MSNEPQYSVRESTITDVIAAIAARHDREHRNCDYEVCDDPICAAGWQLETETAVFAEFSEDWARDEMAAKEQP